MYQPPKNGQLHGCSKHLQAFKVAKLKELCRSIGLPRSGRKQDLIDSLSEYIGSQTDPPILVAIEALINRLKEHPDLPSLNKVVSRINSHGDARIQDVFDDNNNVSTKHRTSNNDHPKAVSDVNYIFAPNLFYKVERCISFSPEPVDKRANVKQLLTLNINIDSDLRSQLKDPTFKIYLMAGKITKSHNSTMLDQIYYPEKMQLNVNDTIIDNTDGKGLKDDPSTNRPFDITRFAHKANHAVNIRLTYIDPSLYRMYVYLVKSFNTQDILNGLLIPTYDKDMELVKIKDYYNTDDDTLEVGSINISLRCPLTATPIKTPIRSVYCDHMQCFDLYNFLEVQRLSNSWRCPVCNIKIKLEELRKSMYVIDIINQTDVELVTILEDGSIRLALSPESKRTVSLFKKTKEPEPEIIIISDDDMDLDVYPEKIHQDSVDLEVESLLKPFIDQVSEVIPQQAASKAIGNEHESSNETKFNQTNVSNPTGKINDEPDTPTNGDTLITKPKARRNNVQLMIDEDMRDSVSVSLQDNIESEKGTNNNGSSTSPANLASDFTNLRTKQVEMNSAASACKPNNAQPLYSSLSRPSPIFHSKISTDDPKLPIPSKFITTPSVSTTSDAAREPLKAGRLLTLIRSMHNHQIPSDSLSSKFKNILQPNLGDKSKTSRHKSLNKYVPPINSTYASANIAQLPYVHRRSVSFLDHIEDINEQLNARNQSEVIKPIPTNANKISLSEYKNKNVLNSRKPNMALWKQLPLNISALPVASQTLPQPLPKSPQAVKEATISSVPSMPRTQIMQIPSVINPTQFSNTDTRQQPDSLDGFNLDLNFTVTSVGDPDEVFVQNFVADNYKDDDDDDDDEVYGKHKGDNMDNQTPEKRARLNNDQESISPLNGSIDNMTLHTPKELSTEISYIMYT